MSKIKMKLVLPLQEQAENLGFSTVQDALDNGYHVVENLVDGHYTLEKLTVDESLEQAHREWLARKENILKNLEILVDVFNPDSSDENSHYTVMRILNDTIDFIKEVKYEQ